jgi:hypothetical protein
LLRYCLKLRIFNDRFFLLRILNYTVLDVKVELNVLSTEQNPSKPPVVVVVVGCESNMLVDRVEPNVFV